MINQNTGTIKGMRECYQCSSEGVYGIVLSPDEVYSCDQHYTELMERFIRNKRFSNANLHLSVDTYEDTRTHKMRKITTGKAFEIEHRTLAEDGKTVINSRTGKEAQY